MRLYVVGDIHGRIDLLQQLVDKINEDSRKTSVPSRKIFLGDYIDRGLHSRQVLDFLIDLKKKEERPPVFLLGNHEQVMREILRTRKRDLLVNWLRFGGRETLMSYGVSPSVLNGNPQQVVHSLIEHTPPAHALFLAKLKTWATFGDYFFCHAGVRPGIPLEAQSEQDLVWIRRDFLDHEDSHGKMVVHGHTIRPQVEFKPNRIDIDTGAYATGRLTALALEGDKRWLLQTSG